MEILGYKNNFLFTQDIDRVPAAFGGVEASVIPKDSFFRNTRFNCQFDHMIDFIPAGIRVVSAHDHLVDQSFLIKLYSSCYPVDQNCGRLAVQVDTRSENQCGPGGIFGYRVNGEFQMTVLRIDDQGCRKVCKKQKSKRIACDFKRFYFPGEDGNSRKIGPEKTPKNKENSIRARIPDQCPDPEAIEI